MHIFPLVELFPEVPDSVTPGGIHISTASEGEQWRMGGVEKNRDNERKKHAEAMCGARTHLLA